MENSTGETATHTPADTNTPYAGPITEPIGSEIHFGADGKRDVSMPMLIGGGFGCCQTFAAPRTLNEQEMNHNRHELKQN